MQMTVRDFLIASVYAGRRLNLFGVDIPPIPIKGQPWNPDDKSLCVALVAVGDEAVWLKDVVAQRVALSMAAGENCVMKGFEPGNP